MPFAVPLNIPITQKSAVCAMAVRASATAPPPPLPLPPSPRLKASSLSKLPPKPQFSPNSLSVSLTTSATLSLLPLFTAPSYEAKALSLPKEEIVSSLTQVEYTINQFQQLGLSTFGTAGRVIGPVVEFVKPGIYVALPILKRATEEVVNITSPVISAASNKALEAIQGSGIDIQPVLTAAKTVADVVQQTYKVIQVAKPIASSTVESILSAEPSTILGTGGAFVIAYILLPPISSTISFSLRGYKGDLTPAQTLDLMCTKNYIMVDIRSEKDKGKAGIPRLPSSAKNKMIAIPLEDLPSPVRRLVRSPKKVEADLVALKISYLKKINKGSNIVIMDSYSDSAKIVARALTSLGFKNCWVVNDGFSGSRGWLQSKLGTDSYNVSFAEVLSPSRIIPAGSRPVGTRSVKLLSRGTD
ncbi:calcium sensing receptor, chloroplastic-like [Ipomoea triloba]|uniref:calcium sensing receptor, chloroplastic-like n=1 Tax=Ipomoea triloba TaxID=35885 RepID=UPI00125D7D76|nr:calcium sensing receptor, chloroplastic-like [Ipomoea triloba]